MSNNIKSIDKTSFSIISYKASHHILAKKISISLISIFYDVFIRESELNWDSYRSSYGKIISKFHLLDLTKVSRKLLRRINENRNSVHSLFLDLLELLLLLQQYFQLS